MKQHIQEIIVVEGTSDVAFLSSFLDADFVTTGGSSLDDATIKTIQTLGNQRGVILLLDPDYPGETIRKKLTRAIPNAKQAFINPKLAKKGKKLGVAECNKEEVLRALSSLVTFQERVETLSLKEFHHLGLIGKEDSSSRRLLVEKTFPLGHGTGKTLWKRLNGLGITYQELVNVLGEQNG